MYIMAFIWLQSIWHDPTPSLRQVPQQVSQPQPPICRYAWHSCTDLGKEMDWRQAMYIHCGLVTPYGDRSGSTLAQVMACCLTAPSHYLNQCWLIIHGVLWHSPKIHSTGSAQNIILLNELKKCTCKSNSASLRGQWVYSLWPRDTIWRQIWVNIGSGNGLLPDGTKPLPEPMLTDHQWSPVTFILGQFLKRCLNYRSLKPIWKSHI